MALIETLFRKGKKSKAYKKLTVSGEVEMEKFIKEIIRLAEKEKISMEVMNQLPYFLKKELKRNSERLEKEKAFTVSERY